MIRPCSLQKRQSYWKVMFAQKTGTFCSSGGAKLWTWQLKDMKHSPY